MSAQRNAVVVDIDGTLTDRSGQFDPDPINNPAIDMINDLALIDYDIILITSQSATNRATIKQWLELNGVPFHQLHTRMPGDVEDGNILKTAMYDRIATVYTVRHLLTGDRDMWIGVAPVWELALP